MLSSCSCSCSWTFDFTFVDSLSGTDDVKSVFVSSSCWIWVFCGIISGWDDSICVVGCSGEGTIFVSFWVCVVVILFSFSFVSTFSLVLSLSSLLSSFWSTFSFTSVSLAGIFSSLLLLISSGCSFVTIVSCACSVGCVGVGLSLIIISSSFGWIFSIGIFFYS